MSALGWFHTATALVVLASGAALRPFLGSPTPGAVD
jgi:hypothetical protein